MSKIIDDDLVFSSFKIEEIKSKMVLNVICIITVKNEQVINELW